jgi:hypothetical protein
MKRKKFEGATDVISYHISNEKKKDENTNNDPQNKRLSNTNITNNSDAPKR